MAVFELILCIIAAVVVSSFVSRFVPKVSTPLVQIVLGVLVTYLPFFPDATLDPELFMVLFIAPLLYLEAHEIDKSALLKTLDLSLSLAIGLAIVTMAVVGFTLHAVWPSITLASALALGAALGPTDAVAVSSLGKEASLTQRQRSVLKGESLFNDASGIVGFQFALAAAFTGEFAVGQAAGEFVISFFGGTLFGLVIAAVANWLFETVRSLGWETTTTRILMELFLPFLLYLGAEEFNVSGILSVVAAGLFIRFDRTGVGPNVARTNIVSTSVWGVLSFSLNGAVFILLGMQLPRAMRASWSDPYIKQYRADRHYSAGHSGGNRAPILLDCGHAARCARYNHRPAPQNGTRTLALGRSDDLWRPQGNHHAVIDVHHPVLHRRRCAVPDA